MTALLYVYAILPASAPALTAPDARPLLGIDGAPVIGVGAVGLTAAVSEVPEAEFEAEPLNRLVRSLDWLGPRAAQHQQVNAALFAQSDALVPLSFGTVYRDRSGVVAMLEARRQALHNALEEVRGRAEWVATLQRDAGQALAALEAHSATLRDLRRGIAGGPPGRAYLLSRQVEAVQRRELLAQDGCAVAAFEQLQAGAIAAYPEALEAGTDHGVLARVSFLLNRRDEPDWLVTVQAYQQRWLPLGYELRLTGPWPPYRFSREAEAPRVRP